MLSQKEAVQFLSRVLAIERPMERKEEDSLGFLNELIVRFHHIIPFQSLSLIAVDPHLRRKPRLEEIKQEVMSKRGGLCYSLNTFMKFLLEALGYTVYFVNSSILAPDNHIITVVCNLKSDGDRYLVDAGLGYPTFQAIPLNFERESATYKESFLEYKFVRENGQIHRWHHITTEPRPVKPEDINGDWKRVVRIDMTPRDFDTFDAPMDLVYTNPVRTPFHTSLRAVAYVDHKAVCVKDMSLLLEDDNHTLCKTKLADINALLLAVQRYFPQLYSTAVDSLKNYKPEC